MAFLEFDDSLKVGNKIIDQEHAMLIDYINLLQKSVENEISQRLLGDVLMGLVEYTKTHFFVEEEFMRAFAYPDAAAHNKAHEGFRQRLDALLKEFEKGDMDSQAVLEFLKDWLTSHILKIDRKLSEFLKDKNLGD